MNNYKVNNVAKSTSLNFFWSNFIELNFNNKKKYGLNMFLVPKLGREIKIRSYPTF